MKTAKTPPLILSWTGCGLLIAGLALSLLLGVMQVPLSGPGGMVIAILYGCGLCVLLFTTFCRWISVPVLPVTNSGAQADSEGRKGGLELRVWRAKFATCYAMMATILAVALYAVGIPVAFIGFDFAKGTNDFGFIVMVTGMAVGAVAIICGLVAIALSGIATIGNGHFRWLLVAFAISVFQVVTLLVIRTLLN